MTSSISSVICLACLKGRLDKSMSPVGRFRTGIDACVFYPIILQRTTPTIHPFTFTRTVRILWCLIQVVSASTLGTVDSRQSTVDRQAITCFHPCGRSFSHCKMPFRPWWFQLKPPSNHYQTTIKPQSKPRSWFPCGLPLSNAVATP
jgi:hypothetical protein